MYSPNNNSNNNNPYQQIPANMGDPTNQVAYQQQQQQQALLYPSQQQQQYQQSQQIYQGNPQPYSNQNPLQYQPQYQNPPYSPVNNMIQPPPPFPNPNFIPAQPMQYLQDSVNTYTTLRYGGTRQVGQNIGQDALLQGVINNPIIAALREIWESLPLNYQNISLRQFKLFSSDYVQQAIFQPLVNANPQIPQEAIFSGKIIRASNILQQKIRKNVIAVFFLAFIAISFISVMEIVYSNNLYGSDYNDNSYLLVLYIVGQIWTAFQLILTLLAVRSVSMQLIKVADGFQTLYLIFSLVVFICGIISMQDLYYPTSYTYLIQVFGVFYLICSVTLKFQLQQMKCYFMRLFVLTKQLPEKDLM